MDPRLPRLDAFVAALPDGLDSHPRTRAKASLYRVYCGPLLEAMRRSGCVLPTPVQELVEDPAPVTAWIPLVRAQAVMLASCDLVFESEDAFVQHTLEHQRTLLSSRLYRIMLALASPATLLRVASARWASFHRGSTLSVETSTPTSTILRVEHPEGLWHGVMVSALAAGLQAPLELSGAKDVRLELLERTDTRVRLQGSWSL